MVREDDQNQWWLEAAVHYVYVFVCLLVVSVQESPLLLVIAVSLSTEMPTALSISTALIVRVILPNNC